VEQGGQRQPPTSGLSGVVALGRLGVAFGAVFRIGGLEVSRLGRFLSHLGLAGFLRSF
jgi:hypothetical protein